MRLARLSLSHRRGAFVLGEAIEQLGNRIHQDFINDNPTETVQRKHLARSMIGSDRPSRC